MKKQIPIYAEEEKAGIASNIAKANSIAYTNKIITSPESLHNQLIETAKLSLGNKESFDLYPISTILVTTGWNRNDDIFDRNETWLARATPEDKPFNLGHKPRQIIGHIIDNIVVDDNLEIVTADSVDDLPAKFHILTNAVIYKHLHSKDEDLTKEVAQLIAGIQNGDWFVSMECLFCDFDYGITHASGEQEVIKRNSTTAFLTKHLRMYGGEGEFNGGKLGRVLRDITFSGKGLVENPANPESVILNDTKVFVGTIATNERCQTLGDNNMSEKYVETLESQVANLQKQLAEANEKIEKLGEATITATIAEKDSEIAKLTEAKTASESKVEELTKQIAELNEAKVAIESAKKEAEDALAEANSKLSAIEKEATKANRISTLVDLGVDKAEAEEVVADFEGLSDEKFEKVAALKAKAAKKYKEDEEEDEEMKKKKKKSEADEEGDESSDKAGEASADDVDLENAEANNEPSLASENGDSEESELMQGLAEFLDKKMHG